MIRLFSFLIKSTFLILITISCTQNRILSKQESKNKAQNLYLKFDTTVYSKDKVLMTKHNYPVDQYREKIVYCFYYDNFSRYFYTPNQNKYEIINENKVLDYNPIDIYNLGRILKQNKIESLTEYFENFQNIYIIDMNLLEKKAKIIKVKQFMGDFTIFEDD